MDNIIITTTDTIEGHQIKEYKGLVSFRAWTPSNKIFVGDTDKHTDEYRKFIRKAEDGLRQEAAALGANAIVGLKLFPPTGGLAAVMILTGTAVVIGY